jgi:hypothetical protein
MYNLVDELSEVYEELTKNNEDNKYVKKKITTKFGSLAHPEKASKKERNKMKKIYAIDFEDKLGYFTGSTEYESLEDALERFETESTKYQNQNKKEYKAMFLSEIIIDDEDDKTRNSIKTFCF